jgi:hypothetical protein
MASKGYRFILRTGIEPAEMRKPGCLVSQVGCVSLITEHWQDRVMDELAPVTPSDHLTYWIAQIQTTTGRKLMVLTTDKEDEAEADLGAPGAVWVWAHGRKEILILPVAAAPLDPADDRLGHVIAYCQHHGLILPAYRPPGASVARTSAD